MKKYLLLIPILTVIAFIFIANKKIDLTDNVTNKQSKLSYIALGDSVSAGVGLPDASDSSACNRTNNSYPNLLAANIYDLINISCSGATLASGATGPQDVNNLQIEPQIDQLKKLPKPELITITFGANDANWTRVLANCYLSSCGNNNEIDKKNFENIYNNYSSFLANLNEIYKDTTPPNIIITGYYQIFPSTLIQNCRELSGITKNELTWGRNYINELNKTIEAAAKAYSYIKFITPDFSGHELCTNDSWIQNLNDRQPYHPNELGQQNIADQIQKLL